MDERHPAEAAVHRAQQRKGNGVVPSDREEVRRAREQLVGAALDLLHGPEEIERRADDVARVGDLLDRERLDLECGIVGAEQAGDLTDGRGTEPGSRTERRAGVERNTGGRDVTSLHGVEEGETSERGEAGEPGDGCRVHGPDRVAGVAGVAGVSLFGHGSSARVAMVGGA